MKSGCASSQQNMMTIMMKMAVVSTITVFLLCCSVFASKDSQNDCDSFAARNENFTVPLNFKLEGKHRLKWRHNDEVIFDRNKLKVIEGKEDDVSRDGSLELKKVGKTAEGTYTPEVYEDGKGEKNLKSIKLCVIDHVAKPTVKIECVSSTSLVKFTCNVSPPAGKFNIEWLQDNKVLSKDKNKASISMKTKDVETNTFSCNVSNPVSYWISPSVKQNCTKSGFVFPETLLGLNTWIFVGIGGGVVLLLIIAVIVCIIRNRRRKRMQLKNEEEFRLELASNQPQHNHQHNHPPNQHHHHHHHHQQQPAGHTGPRQHRSRQQRNQQRIGAPDQPSSQPQPSPRRSAQGPRPDEKYHDEQPPPLPQPRKKAPKTQRV